MRIATRLVLTLTLVVAAVMWIYALISLSQREELISDALIRETETQGQTLQIVLNNALRDQRFTDIDRVLGRVRNDPETFVSAMLDSVGGIHTGGPEDSVRCIVEANPQVVQRGQELRGWADCDGRIRWVVLPVSAPASAVLLGRRATVVEQDMAGTRWRVFLTTLVLAATAGLSILLVLRRTLSLPLAGILRGVYSLGGPNPALRVEVPAAAGELHELAGAFNEMADRLEGKRRSLLRETEERVELERQLRRVEKFAALGRFTGGLAHEIGTPLNVIEVRAEAIAADRTVPDAARRHADEIVSEIDRIADLIRGLSHIARRHAVVREERVNLTEVVAAVLDDLRLVADNSSTNVIFQPRGDSIMVEGDGTLIRHAINNLVLNAIQALAEHDGKREVRIELERAGRVVRLNVDDTGPGIAADHFPHLFEPFFTTRDIGEGTGLGLAISLGIAEEHGGSLRLEPREGGGVRATLTLPASEPAPRETPS